MNIDIVLHSNTVGHNKLSTTSTALEIKARNKVKHPKSLIILDVLEWEVYITEDNPEK